MKKLLLCSIVALISSCVASAKKPVAVFFKADAPEIVYQGRIDFTDPQKPRFCHSGVNISTIIYTQNINMMIEDLSQGDEKHTNYYLHLNHRIVLLHRVFRSKR